MTGKPPVRVTLIRNQLDSKIAPHSSNYYECCLKEIPVFSSSLAQTFNLLENHLCLSNWLKLKLLIVQNIARGIAGKKNAAY